MPFVFTCVVAPIATIVSAALVAVILCHPSRRQLHLYWISLSLLLAVLLQAIIVLPLELFAIKTRESGLAACHSGVFLDRVTTVAVPLMLTCLTVERLLGMLNNTLMSTDDPAEQLTNGATQKVVLILILASWAVALVAAGVTTYALHNPDRGSYPVGDCHAIWLQFTGRELAELLTRVVAPLVINFPVVVMLVVSVCSGRTSACAWSTLLVLSLHSVYALFVWPLPVYIFLLTPHGLPYNGHMVQALVDVHRAAYIAVPLVMLLFALRDSLRGRKVIGEGHHMGIAMETRSTNM